MKPNFELLENGKLWKEFGIQMEKDTPTSIFIFDKEKGVKLQDNIAYVFERNGEMTILSDSGEVSFPVSEILLRIEDFLYSYFFGGAN